MTSLRGPKLLMILSLTGLITSTSAMANTNKMDYPDGFSFFFDETEQYVHIVIAGEKEGARLPALVNYDTFRIEEGTDSLVRLREFLRGKNISSAEVDVILNDVVNGIVTDEDCSESLSDCLLNLNDQDTRYVFDFDNQILKLFIPPQAVEAKSASKEYRSSVSPSNAINNWSNLYLSTDLEGRESFNFNNQTTIGLPLGYIFVDSELTNEDSEIYTAIYDVDFSNGYRVQVGQSRYNPEFNSTDFLSDGADFSGNGLSLGTSNNLLAVEVNSLQSIQFYAPQNGQLEIYRDDRLIYNQVVNEGQQTISYGELPKGVYDISLTLKVAGNVVLEEKRQIINNDQFSLAVEDFDFSLGLGQLEFEDGDFNNIDEEDAVGRKYLRGAATYRFAENMLFGAALTSNDDSDRYVQMGASFLLAENISFGYSAGIFTNSDYYYSGRLSLGSVYFDFENFTDNERSNELSLSNYLYTEGDDSNFGVGWFGYLGGGNVFVHYSRYKQEYWNRVSHVDNNLYESLSASWSRPLFGGFLTLSTSYTESQFSDDFSASMSWSHEFGSGVSGQMIVNVDGDGFSQNSNYIRYDRQDGDLYSNLSVGGTIYDNKEVSAELSGTVTGSIDKANVNLYAFTREGAKNISGSISGTQIFTTQDVYFTNEKGRSFSNVNVLAPQNSEEAVVDQLYVHQTKGGKFNSRTELQGSEELIRLTDFQQMGLVVEPRKGNIEVLNNRKDMFAHPGSFYQMDVEVEHLLSKVVILDDIEDNAVSQVQCVGNGCIDVEPVTEDGVFRVKYRSNEEYYLVSNKGLCVYEHGVQDGINRGYCLPGIEADHNKGWEESSQLLAKNNPVYMYLGKFEETTDSNHVVSRLRAASIKYKEISVNGTTYIYAIDGQRFDNAQKEILKQLDAYVMLQSAEFDYLSLSLNRGLQNEK